MREASQISEAIKGITDNRYQPKKERIILFGKILSTEFYQLPPLGSLFSDAADSAGLRSSAPATPTTVVFRVA